MSDQAAPLPGAPDPPGYAPVNYLNETWGLKSWLLTLDHKRIAILYLISATFYFSIGGLMAALIRIELATPQGDLVTPDWYNRLFTMHGVMMIFFFLIPVVPGVLGNFLLPLMIGAKDVAFPKINLLSWYLYNIGALFTLWALVHGGIDTGWTFYTPFSTTFSNTHVIAVGLGIFINGFSSILTGVNFIVTTHRLRAPGQGWFRLPLFVWGIYATSLIQVLGTPVLAITILLLAAERLFQIGVFDPKYGGDPVLFQHFFWFYSHPAVYIMILPAMGVISEIVAAFSRKRIFGYRYVAFASVGIATLGFLVWAHHMFVAGISVYAGAVFSILTMAVAVPSAVKVFNWTATLYKGSVQWETPLVYALGFIGVFTIGGLSGTMLATLGLDAHIHDTYFLVAHFHYVMVGSAVMGYLGGMHYWWPKITGRLYPRFLSTFAAVVVFIGFNVTFFPQFILGYLGMPRRYYTYPPEFQVLNVMSSAGATILGVGYLIPIFYFLWSLKFGEKASANPWGAVGLEWETTSPPPAQNFETPPVVTSEAYDYKPRPRESRGEVPAHV
jgi:cytochrome c oxidase subunit 1